MASLIKNSDGSPHIHTYIRRSGRLVTEGTMRCNDPKCTHIILKKDALGKESLCTQCHGVMILTREDLRRARPRCLNCSATQESERIKKNKKVFEELGLMS